MTTEPLAYSDAGYNDTPDTVGIRYCVIMYRVTIQLVANLPVDFKS